MSAAGDVLDQESRDRRKAVQRLRDRCVHCGFDIGEHATIPYTVNLICPIHLFKRSPDFNKET